MLYNAASDPKHTSVSHSASTPVQSMVAALTLSRLDYGCSTMAGLPARQLNRLQSVLNAAARLVYSVVSPHLRELHWLRVPQRIEFRLVVLAYRCLIGTAPQSLADALQRVTDISSQSAALWSTALLHVPRLNHKTIGDRAFPVAAAKVWNSLPPWKTSLPSLLQFRKGLKS